VLRHLPPVLDPNVLVGTSTSDDAAVYKLTPDLAVVATVDYITPVVDDPFVFGQVAVANAVSDVYAMGARPLFGLNVVNFPRDRLPLDTLEAILAGGAAKAAEADMPILGGHSIDDPEPKYGMAVFGSVHPERVVTNAGAQPDDRLILTKPLGVGIITTAIKRDLAPPEVAAAAVASMTTLNRAAAEAMLEVGVHACTDITGFGLLGHLGEMLRASGVGARIVARNVPVLKGVWDLVAREAVPGGTLRNLESVGEFVRFGPNLDRAQQIVLADAQTSGGLLIAASQDRAERLVGALGTRGIVAAEIGVCTDEPRWVQVNR
jgi:selenide,water dikinase